MTTERFQLGQYGEELAVKHLKDHGYRIIERNFRLKQGELDIVASDSGTLCFVEVKVRQSRRQGCALEAVSSRKQRKIARLAYLYLKSKGVHSSSCRFDVVAIDQDCGQYHIQLVKNAFDATDMGFN